MGPARLLVERGDGGLGVGAGLAGGGPQGVGGLQGVAALGPPAAALAVSDGDVELPAEGLTRDLGLKLLRDRGFDQLPLAMRTGFGEPDLMDRVDLLRRGRWPCVPCCSPALRPGRLGWALGGPVRKGAAGRLPARRAASSSARRRATSAVNASIWRCCC